MVGAQLVSPTNVKDHSPPSTAAENSSPKHFHLFSTLPQEIRLKIWDMATEEQRIVKLKRMALSIFGGLTYSTPHPPVLQACAESREVGLKRYTLAFGRPLKCDSDPPRQHSARIHFNFDNDFLYYFSKRGKPDYWTASTGRCGRRIDAKDIERVRFLGYDLDLITYAPYF